MRAPGTGLAEESGYSHDEDHKPENDSTREHGHVGVLKLLSFSTELPHDDKREDHGTAGF
jgi:hypothetical protein